MEGRGNEGRVGLAPKKLSTPSLNSWLRPLVYTRFQSKSQAWNSSTTMKRGSIERAQIHRSYKKEHERNPMTQEEKITRYSLVSQNAPSFFRRLHQAIHCV